MKKLLFLFMIMLPVIFHSCSNQEIEFPDYDYQTVYFAYQYPVRTITLGEDFVNTTMDNEHKFQIMATLGGVYSNKNNVTVNFVVDTSLCSGYHYENGDPIRVLPESYYQLASNSIVIPAGKIAGGVEVQLTDAFFADTLAVNTNYVVPIRMVSVENADSVLRGKPNPVFTNPRRLVDGDWEILPKDFVLYAVKYVNPWHGFYLRRGIELRTRDGIADTVIRHSHYVEDDQVWKLNTLSLNDLHYPMDYKSRLSHDLKFGVKLGFDENLEFTVSPPASAYQVNDTVRVYNITATGNGKFIKEGEKNSWGNKDRDAMYLKYDVGYEVEISYPKADPPKPPDIQQVTYSSTDTLVLRNRGVEMEVFKVAVP
ncbi:MAG: DUF5627 domain-containing protein [Bacteroidales bacterium]